MTTAFVALGSNLAGVLESPQAQLNAALAAMDDLAFSRIRRVSSFYSTPAWQGDDPGDDDQARYVNAVAEIHTDLAADALLHALQGIETSQGRVRDPDWQNAPRTLDLDLLIYGGIRLKTIELTCPHPRMHERAFVLLPLLEIAPDIIIPGLGKAQSYLAALTPSDIYKLEPEFPNGLYQP
jgi:2-amino-4-hydroxy-6-hydroxymethyldihydropteridine diphosphokinase